MKKLRRSFIKKSLTLFCVDVEGLAKRDNVNERTIYVVY